MTSGTTLKAENCIKACAERAWRLAYALVWNTEDAHDVVQQACLVAAVKADRIPQDDPWPWFARVITLECRKLREARAKAARLASALQNEAVMAKADNTAETRELNAKLGEALQQLPAEQRDAVVLTHIGGLSMREAASSLGVSSSTVDRRVKQGLDGLRSRLGAEKSALSAALVCLPFDEPAKGMQAALAEWLSMVRSPELAVASAGGMTMLKYIAITCLALVVLGSGAFFAYIHVTGTDANDFHEMMRQLHGPGHQPPPGAPHHP